MTKSYDMVLRLKKKFDSGLEFIKNAPIQVTVFLNTHQGDSYMPYFS